MDVYAALDDTLVTVTNCRDSPAVASVLDEYQFECVAARHGSHVFAGTVESGLLRSPDGGRHWESVGSFEDRVTAVAISPHDPAVVWVGTEPSAVYRSEDGGDSWTHCDGLTALPSADRWSFPPRPDTHHVRWLSVDPHDEKTVYVAIEAGAFVRTTDGGKTWDGHPAGARRDNHTLRTHVDVEGRIYTAAGDGYAESTDRGETWDYPQDGLEHRYVWGLAVDAGDPDTVVVSAANSARSAHNPQTADAHIYRRQGNSWEMAMDGLPDSDGLVRAVLDSSSATGEFLALTNQGLFYSRDAAVTWERVDVEWPERYETQVGRGLAVFG